MERPLDSFAHGLSHRPPWLPKVSSQWSVESLLTRAIASHISDGIVRLLSLLVDAFYKQLPGEVSLVGLGQIIPYLAP